MSIIYKVLKNPNAIVTHFTFNPLLTFRRGLASMILLLGVTL